MEPNQLSNHPKRSLLKEIFISPDEPRLRAGWRLLIMTAANFILMMLLIMPFAIVYKTKGSKVPFLLVQSISFISITIVVFLSRKVLDRRSIKSLGLDFKENFFQDILIGILVSAVILGIIFLAEWALGYLTIQGFSWQTEPLQAVLTGTLSSAILFILTGWIEELQFRGYYLQNLADGINMTWAIILSAIWFAVMHLFNPNASMQIIPGLFIAGVFFAFAYIRTRQLWLAIGIHIGWNYFEGTVYGFQVSGIDIYRLVIQDVQGPKLITGGAFGPEAGLILFPAIAIGFGLIYLYTKNRIGASDGARPNGQINP